MVRGGEFQEVGEVKCRKLGLRSAEPVDDDEDLARGESFVRGVVAGVVELLEEDGVAPDERHEAVDGGGRGDVGEVEDGEFFFCEGARGEG